MMVFIDPYSMVVFVKLVLNGQGEMGSFRSVDFLPLTECHFRSLVVTRRHLKALWETLVNDGLKPTPVRWTSSHGQGTA